MAALRITAALVLSAIWLALLVPDIFTMSAERDDFGITLMQGPSAPDVLARTMTIAVQPGSPASRAGLRTGDVISCFSRATADHIFVKPMHWSNVPVKVCVQRRGSWQPVTISPRVEQWRNERFGNVAAATVRLAVYLAFLVSAIAMLAGKPGLMTWCYFAFALGTGGLYSARQYYAGLEAWWYTPAIITLYVSALTTSPFLLLFVLRLPDDKVDGWRVTAFRAACTVTLAYVLYIIVFLVMQQPGPVPLRFIASAFGVIVAVEVLTRLFIAKSAERSRFVWAAAGILFGLAALQIDWSLGVVPDSVRVLFACLSVFMPIALMYAILRRHLIDLRFIVSRTVLFGGVTSAVVLIIACVDWLTSVYLAQSRAAMAVDALVTIALGVALHRTYNWFEALADRLVFRKKYEAESYLDLLGKSLLRAERQETIDRALVHDPFEKLDLRGAALFHVDSGSGLFTAACVAAAEQIAVPALDTDNDVLRFVKTLREPVRLRQMRGTALAVFGSWCEDGVAIPVAYGDSLIAFALYGNHAAGTGLDPDEVRVLERLCASAAHAYAKLQYQQYRAWYESAHSVRATE